MSYRNCVLCSVTVALAFCSHAALAQSGGVDIPRVLDRPISADQGPRVPVQRFDLAVDGEPSSAWVEEGHLARMRAMLDEALAAQPSGGFPITGLEDVAQRLEDYIREQGYVVAQVYVPEQTVSSGVVTVQVLQGRLGRVLTEGNKRYADRNLARPFRELVGAPVEQESLESALLHVTDLPGITVLGVLGEGAEVGTTDLSLRVQAENPWTAIASADNYGTESTGEIRGVVSATWNNPTGNGDRLTLTVQQTANPANGTYGGIDYEIPLPGLGTSAGVAYNENSFDVSSDFADLGIKGKTQIASLYVRQTMARSRNFNLYGTASLDVERAEADLQGIPEFKDKLSVIRLQLGFDAVDTRFRGLNQGSIEYHGGIKDFLGSMGDVAREPTPSRQGGSGLFASGDFDKWYGRFSRLQFVRDNMSLLLRTELQISDDLLTSLEQFSLGGPNTVRAYPQAEVLADTAAFFSAELILNAPGFADKPAFGNRFWGEIFQVSLFVDYAGGRNSDPPKVETAAGPFKTDDLSGYGMAFQLNVPGRFLGRLDIAAPISGREPSNGNDPQFFGRINYVF